MSADPWLDALAHGDVDRVREALHDDVTLRAAAPRPVRGRDEVVAWLTTGWAADHSVLRVTDIQTEGDVTVASIEWHVIVAPMRIRVEHALIAVTRADDRIRRIVIDSASL